MKGLAAQEVTILSVTFGLSIGFAVLGAIFVAQRFIERHEGEEPAFPPVFELASAALIVAGLSALLRLGIPLSLALIQGGSPGLTDVVNQFVNRAPGIIIPTLCTVSLGLLCSYLGSLNWRWYIIAAVGALGNGFALMIAGWVVVNLIQPSVLSDFFVDPIRAILIVPMNTAMTGFLVGGMVLAMFNKSQRVRKAVAAYVAEHPETVTPAVSAVEQLDYTIRPSMPEADRNLGGYTRASVEALEGRYVCIRPAFISTDIINAYIIVIQWDETASCLTFEERDRVDAGHVQCGRVYIPNDRLFMSFVTAEKGALRLIMVSRPKGKEDARGLIMTLSNPSGMRFTPVSAPIVLKRVVAEAPQLGFIRPNSRDYDAYRRDLEAVVPEFGFFAAAPGSISIAA